MRHPALLLAAASALLLADVACAQSRPAGEASGARYLSWNDRPQPQPQPVSAPAGRPAEGMRRPNMVIPHGGFAQVEEQRLTPAPGTRYGGGLTPANAWLHGRGALPAETAQPEPRPTAPTSAAAQPRDEIAYAAPAATQIEAPRELTPPGYPDYLPSRGYRQYVPGDVAVPVQPTGSPTYHGEDNQPGRPQPNSPRPQRDTQPVRQAAARPSMSAPQPAPREAAPQPEPQSPPSAVVVQPTADAGFDPMAPRRDAPIFRIQQQGQPAPQPAPQAATAQAPQSPPAATRQDPNAPRRVAMVTSNTADRPGRDQGARYYSVHRQNGQQPDAIAMPEPTYVDALAVNMTETPASQDLAAPDAGPTLIRDNQGRLRAAPAASNGDHQ